MGDFNYYGMPQNNMPFSGNIPSLAELQQQQQAMFNPNYGMYPAVMPQGYIPQPAYNNYGYMPQPGMMPVAPAMPSMPTPMPQMQNQIGNPASVFTDSSNCVRLGTFNLSNNNVTPEQIARINQANPIPNGDIFAAERNKLRGDYDPVMHRLVNPSRADGTERTAVYLTNYDGSGSWVIDNESSYVYNVDDLINNITLGNYIGNLGALLTRFLSDRTELNRALIKRAAYLSASHGYPVDKEVYDICNGGPRNVPTPHRVEQQPQRDIVIPMHKTDFDFVAPEIREKAESQMTAAEKVAKYKADSIDVKRLNFDLYKEALNLESRLGTKEDKLTCDLDEKPKYQACYRALNYLITSGEMDDIIRAISERNWGDYRVDQGLLQDHAMTTLYNAITRLNKTTFNMANKVDGKTLAKLLTPAFRLALADTNPTAGMTGPIKYMGSIFMKRMKDGLFNPYPALEYDRLHNTELYQLSCKMDKLIYNMHGVTVSDFTDNSEKGLYGLTKSEEKSLIRNISHMDPELVDVSPEEGGYGYIDSISDKDIDDVFITDGDGLKDIYEERYAESAKRRAEEQKDGAMNNSEEEGIVLEKFDSNTIRQYQENDRKNKIREELEERKIERETVDVPQVANSIMRVTKSEVVAHDDVDSNLFIFRTVLNQPAHSDREAFERVNRIVPETSSDNVFTSIKYQAPHVLTDVDYKECRATIESLENISNTPCVCPDNEPQIMTIFRYYSCVLDNATDILKIIKNCKVDALRNQLTSIIIERLNRCGYGLFTTLRRSKDDTISVVRPFPVMDSEEDITRFMAEAQYLYISNNHDPKSKYYVKDVRFKFVPVELLTASREARIIVASAVDRAIVQLFKGDKHYLDIDNDKDCAYVLTDTTHPIVVNGLVGPELLCTDMGKDGKVVEALHNRFVFLEQRGFTVYKTSEACMQTYDHGGVVVDPNLLTLIKTDGGSDDGYVNPDCPFYNLDDPNPFNYPAVMSVACCYRPDNTYGRATVLYHIHQVEFTEVNAYVGKTDIRSKHKLWDAGRITRLGNSLYVELDQYSIIEQEDTYEKIDSDNTVSPTMDDDRNSDQPEHNLTTESSGTGDGDVPTKLGLNSDTEVSEITQEKEESLKETTIEDGTPIQDGFTPEELAERKALAEAQFNNEDYFAEGEKGSDVAGWEEDDDEELNQSSDDSEYDNADYEEDEYNSSTTNTSLREYGFSTKELRELDDLGVSSGQLLKLVSNPNKGAKSIGFEDKRKSEKRNRK